MSDHYRMIGVFSFAVMAMAFLTLDVSAQYARKSSIRPQSVAEKQRALKRLSPELQHHTVVLQQVLSRYLSSGDAFTPYLRSKHFWLELRKSRQELQDGTRRTKQEKLVLRNAYSELEQDVLMLMLGDQMAIYQDALELNEVQYERVESTLRKDADAKFLLAIAKETTDDTFFQRLMTISKETESAIRGLLFPEQQRLYDKRQTELKMIWTG